MSVSHNPLPELRREVLENRYRLLVESIKDYAIYMLTPEGLVESWNTGAQHFKGYNADEVIGRYFGMFYTPEDQAAGMPSWVLRTAAEEGRFEGEGWRVRKDGSRFWAHVVVDPVRSPAGELLGYAKITRDITEKKLAQDALRESEQRFRLLVSGVTDYAIYMLSPTGQITNWNAGAQRIKGYSAEEVIGTHFSRFYPEEERARKIPEFALETARTKNKFEAEGWRVRKDGSRFWAHVVIDPIYDDNGILAGFAKITRDITEKRKADEMLEQTRAALFQSQKMEAIGKLTGGIAHDFNNLLAGIMGHLELIRLRLKLGQVSEIDRSLEAAITAAKRSAALTHRLLSFARRQTLQPKPVDALALVRSLMDLMQHSVGPDIEISIRPEKDLWPTICDPNQLENALLNLIVNAKDAMPDGGKIEIQIRNITVSSQDIKQTASIRPGDYVCIAVADNGSGMAQEVLSQVFEPFFTTKPFGEGTGLGLPMVQGFVLQSGGQIAIDSKPGKGTVVSLYLPRTNADTREVAENTDTPVLAASGEKRKVLVVEDEEVVRSVLLEVLNSMGYTPLLAQDGHDGLRMLESTAKIDLLITDIGLPGGMNGRQLAGMAQRIRPGLRVLLITGYAEQSVMGGTGLPSGVQLLVKPFAVKMFADTVHSMLQD